MLGIIGLTAILGCISAIAAVVAVASVAVSVGVGVAQMNQAEEMADKAQDAQEAAETKAENRAKSQKEAAFRAQEKQNLVSVMSMGSAILAEQISARKAKYETVEALKESNGTESNRHYSYGKPAAPVESSQQSQSQTNT